MIILINKAEEDIILWKTIKDATFSKISLDKINEYNKANNIYNKEYGNVVMMNNQYTRLIEEFNTQHYRDIKHFNSQPLCQRKKS